MVWTIGTLVYEFITLEPAYYDRENSGNLMAVTMSIIQGAQPPAIVNTSYTDRLLNFVKQAMSKDEALRPGLVDVILLATDAERQEECD